ncbi:DNA binding domain-containing protein, excisionase family [Nonomuraea solani]|uniref:DNA binding domain-containing protein, excisionase family n=1 Tax=Nonomuraea solani TaxID=1144553 RepID=A0A1H5SU46_9ACTN|nr:helix-turn-helix domain-containing protein [Nonomuraea solani]SEF54112.1 DNA binding domain-containing protein, excisionase family [Nonomuraea solani]
MTAELVERTVLPPGVPLDQLADAVRHAHGGHAELVGASGERIVLPDEVFEVVQLVVLAMAAGQAVTIAPHHQTLTTQEAADLLGVSRPTVVRLLERGEIPYEQPGRHRRILLREVLAYQERRRHQRRASLDRMVEISEEADLYEATADFRPTR